MTYKWIVHTAGKPTGIIEQDASKQPDSRSVEGDGWRQDRLRRRQHPLLMMIRRRRSATFRWRKRLHLFFGRPKQASNNDADDQDDHRNYTFTHVHLGLTSYQIRRVSNYLSHFKPDRLVESRSRS